MNAQTQAILEQGGVEEAPAAAADAIRAAFGEG